MIPVAGGESIYINNSSSSNIYLVALKSFDPVVNGKMLNVSDDSAWSSRREVMYGNDFSGDLPADARWLYMSIKYDGTSTIPSSLKIDGVEFMVSLVDWISANDVEISSNVSSLYAISENSQCPGRPIAPSSSYWQIANGMSHIAVPVKPLDHIEMLGNAANLMEWCIVSSYTVPKSSADKVQYSAVLSVRYNLAANTLTSFDAPYDSAFLVLVTTKNGANCFPQRVLVNGYDIC